MTATVNMIAATLMAAALLTPAMAQDVPAEGGQQVSVQVVATNSTQVGAPMSGKLTGFQFRDGDTFKAGDTLAEFQCDQQKATLGHAQAEAQKRRYVLATQQKLKDLGTWSSLDYQTAGAEVQAAASDLALAQANVANCVVKAPFSGRVSNTMVHNFQFLQVGAPMLDILDDGSLELETIMPSLWLGWMKPGLPFTVDIKETGKSYKAEIVRFSGRVDPVSQTVKVYGRIVGDRERLLPGMSGTARVERPAG